MGWLRNLYVLILDQRTGSGWRLPQLDGVRGVAVLLIVVSAAAAFVPALRAARVDPARLLR